MGKRRGIILTSVIALALVILGGLAVVGSYVHTEKSRHKLSRVMDLRGQVQRK